MRTLLLADDSVTTQRVIALTFADDEYRVVTVSDGQQAIEKMAALRPDIVLAGTGLPRRNGYELAEYMRGVEGLRSVPVLLLSGAFESVDEARLKASGARGILEKPLEPTTVISRVRELLGLKDARPATPGRLVTTADTAGGKRAPVRPAASAPAARQTPASSWDELRQASGLEPDARSVEGGTPGSGREDYLDTLDAAFDSLDQQLAGRHAEARAHRNPSPPLGQASGAPDPRSPGRRPTPKADGVPPNPIFEVDADWFGDDPKALDAAAGRDMVSDANEVMPERPAAAGTPIFEVDDQWFADDEKTREAQQRELAAEMGIHDVDLPAGEPVPNAPSPADGLDFDFGIEDLRPPTAAKLGPVPDSPFAPPSPGPMRVHKPTAPEAPPPLPAEPVALAAPEAPAAPAAPDAPSALEAPKAPEAPEAPEAPWAPEAPKAPGSMASVADDFAALLAFETGEQVYEEPPPPVAAAPPAPIVVQAAAPEITDAMLDQIAERVADRLNSGTFGAGLRDAMTATVRDTVRSVVSETSERLVRDEIARVKAAAERDTP
ncbi:MAG: response regulator [Vicinamibacterales bacterium]|jgi:CheY-like chemotaxis protein